MRVITVIEELFHEFKIESINLLTTTLPFLHSFLIDCAGNKIAIKCLVDSGASISILSKKWIESNNLIFKPIAYNAKLVGFGHFVTTSNLTKISPLHDHLDCVQ